MGLTEVIGVCHYVICFSLFIVLFGVLTKEFFIKKRKERRDIIGWMLVLILGIIYILMDGYRFYLGVDEGVVIFWLTMFSAFVLIAVLIQGLLHWNKINKSVYFFIVIYGGVALIILEGIRFFTGIFLEVVNSGSSMVLLIGYYFIVIDYLTSKKTIKNKSAHFGTIGIALVITILIFSIMGFFHLYEEEEEVGSELNIYNWEDYFSKTTIEDFEKEFGINVTLSTFEDENVLLEEDLGNYDLVVASDVIIHDMAELGLLSSVRRSAIPNLEYIDTKCISEDIQDYAVPYFWGTSGLAINTKYISEDTDSWDVLWDVKYSKKIALLNNPEEVVGMAAKYIGLPLVPRDNFQFRRVEEFLLFQKSLVMGYMNEEEIKSLLVSEELWAAHIYDGLARQVMAENENIQYVVPSEGAAQWVDSFVILKDSPNKNAAEVFINYILSPEVSADIVNYQLGYGCNKEAMKMIEEDFLEDISESSFGLLEYFSDYSESEEVGELRKNLWEELNS